MKNEFLKRLSSSIVLIPLVFLCIIEGSILFNFFLGICFLITLYEWYKMTKNKKYKIFGIFFLIFSFYSIFKLRNIFDGDYWFFIFTLLICISTDIGGYIFGKLFKGPKLTKLSPNKTYSGMVGSYILTITILYFYLINSYLIRPIDITLDLFIFIFLISSVSQIGDLIVSYFKRINKIKDTGKIIPGHGGILDRIDGMLFAFPFTYYLVLINSIGIVS